MVPAASMYPRRRTVRLPAYNYASPAVCFVTMCTHQRALLFERPDHAAAVLAAWEDLPRHYAPVSLDQFVVMPNHVHGIVLLADGDGVGGIANGTGHGRLRDNLPTASEPVEP